LHIGFDQRAILEDKRSRRTAVNAKFTASAGIPDREKSDRPIIDCLLDPIPGSSGIAYSDSKQYERQYQEDDNSPDARVFLNQIDRFHDRTRWEI